MADEFDLEAIKAEIEDGKEEVDIFGLKEQIIFLVDAQPNMLEQCSWSDHNDPNDKGEFENLSWMGAVFKVLAQLMRTKVIAGGADDTAIVLYNTQKEQSPNSIEKVYVLQDLGSPSVERIRELDSFVKDSEFSTEIGCGLPDQHARSVALGNALWEAKVTLANVKSKARKRIMICTRDEQPSATFTEPVSTHIEGLAQTGAFIQLFPLAMSLKEFNLQPFWKDLLQHASPQVDQGAESEQFTLLEEDEERVVPIWSLQSIIRRKAIRKRATAHMKWTIAPGLNIGVKPYSLYASAWPSSKGSPSWAHAMTLEPVKAETTYIDQVSGALVDKKAAQPGQKPRLYFPPEEKDSQKNARLLQRFPKVYVGETELSEVKYPLPKGLKLLGFKPRSALADWHNLRPSTFIYPDEVNVSGSTAVFAALHQVMLEEDMIAVCCLVRGPKSEPRLVAALPQPGETGDDNVQLAPPGIHLIYLPYADDLRVPENDTNFTGFQHGIPSEEQIAAASQMIDSLQLSEFSPGEIPNPHLQRHYHALECIAVGSDVPAEAIDETVPDEKAFEDGGTVAVIQAFKDSVFGAGYDMHAADKAGAKRKRAEPVDKASLTIEVANLKFEELAASNSLSRLTNDELKKYLQLYDLPKSGTKKNLIERIMLHINK